MKPSPATTRALKDSHRRWQPMVERLIAWLLADGPGRMPYRGIEPNQV